MLTSKDFDKKLHIDNFEMLEKEFQNTKKNLKDSKGEFEVSELEKKYPIYFGFNNELYIKFPTFKIRIINNKRTEKELKEILNEYGNFSIYDETNVVSIPSFKSVKSTSIHCLGNSLEENKKMAKNIISKLKNEQIISEKWVTYGRYPILIEYTNEEKTLIKIL